MESVIAIGVMAVTLLPCIALMWTSRRLNQRSQIEGMAYQVARQQLETLKSQRYGNRVNVESTFTIPANVGDKFPQIDMKGYYAIATQGAYTSPPLQKITVRVTWKKPDSKDGVINKIDLCTLIAQEPGK